MSMSRQTRGLGSAKTGTQHWLSMQVTSVALIPLGLYALASFLIEVVGRPDAAATVTAALAWVRCPVNALALVLMLPVAIYHGFNGIISGIFEDYIHHRILNLAGVVAVRFTGAVLAVIGVGSVLKILLGA